MAVAQQITLAARPTGAVHPGDFGHREVVLPALEPGEFRVAVRYLSIDPAIRGWMAHDTYLPKIGIGEVIRAGGAGEVVESRNERFPVGSRVVATTGWQTQVVLANAFRLPDSVSYEDALSVAGVSGLTAYVGMLDIGKPQPGETVVVSAAAGSVGSLAGQIARIRGARVVGIAGSAAKCRWVVDDLGFDACIDYRSEDVRRRLRQECPHGIDVYFDNVGGAILNTVLGQINDHARIVLCGSISDYDSGKPPVGPANLINAIPRRALLQGFIVLDHLGRMAEAAAALRGWQSEGRLVSRVDVRDGLDRAPQALADLFTGGNRGKTLIRLG